MLLSSKEFLRAHYKKIEINERASRSSLLLTCLEPLLPKEGLILSFSSLPHEVDTSEVNEALAKQNRLVLPRVEPNGLLSLHKVQTLSDLKRSAWAILEPSENNPIEHKDISLILVPGLAFDSIGGRLGFGKGYYDQLLAKTECLTIGVTFRENLSQEELPQEPHDRKVNHILTL
jgi:5-formyltetrahydrofolate cyclo-ligase